MNIDELKSDFNDMMGAIHQFTAKYNMEPLTLLMPDEWRSLIRVATPSFTQIHIEKGSSYFGAKLMFGHVQQGNILI